jgi:hypothetical protein
MKGFFKTFIQKVFRIGVEGTYLYEQANQTTSLIHRSPQHPVDKGTQILLSLQYRQLRIQGMPLPSFSDVEFRAYSQNGEDGILLFIFALAGVTNKRVVEICAGDGIECNAANLIVNHSWLGLLFDGNPSNLKAANDFYSHHPSTVVRPPKIVNAWITPENVNDLIKSGGFSGEIDLLSVDIDGMDYWVLQAIDCIDPRVIVLESNSPWGASRSVTIPYQDNFVATFVDGCPEYCGASLTAFVKLLKKKNYRLVALESRGANAFFIRNDICEKEFPEVSAEWCFSLMSWTEADLKVFSARQKRLENRVYIDV